jgi:hypothetical protein
MIRRRSQARLVADHGEIDTHRPASTSSSILRYLAIGSIHLSPLHERCFGCCRRLADRTGSFMLASVYRGDGTATAGSLMVSTVVSDGPFS